jgi:branched-chain amino acid transport system permease protein
VIAVLSRARGGRANRALPRTYGQSLRAFPGHWARLGLVLVAVIYVVTPLRLTDDWLNILTVCGCYAVGAIGLNLLTGFTGQVSIGQAFFVAAGGYTVAHFSSGVASQGHLRWVTQQPLLISLLGAAIVGAILGALIGPFALRLRGNYLAIVTLALLFLGFYLFKNATDLTGGGSGVNYAPSLAIGPFDFTKLHNGAYSDQQGYFWLVWGFVALAALLARNLVRSRAGRAMQAVRDRDLAAEVIGVSQMRTKIGVFAVSSAFASVGGALYYSVIQQNLEPTQVSQLPGLVMSITFVAIIIVGGLGSVWGCIVGALIVQGLPQLINRYTGSLPFLGPDGIMSVASFNNFIFGVMIVAFLLLEPYGLAAVWRRIKGYFQAWPFSY